MKKIGKLSINPEKVIKNEELMILRGGYSSQWWCMVGCTDYEEDGFRMSDQYPEYWMAEADCAVFFNQRFKNCHCICVSSY